MTADLWALLGIVGAAILGAWRLYAKGGKDARRETALEAAERMAKATEAARKAEAKTRKDMAEGATPDDVLRRNDGSWNR